MWRWLLAGALVLGCSIEARAWDPTRDPYRYGGMIDNPWGAGQIYAMPRPSKPVEQAQSPGEPGWRITVCRPAPNCRTLRGTSIPTLDLCTAVRQSIERELGRYETAQCDWQVDG